MKLCERCGACFDDVFELCGYDGGALSFMFSGSRVMAQRYLLEQRVAQGAMGVVLRATHLQLGSTVAVKLMKPQKQGTHVALQRFHREAQILGQIKHPNAVLVIDFGIEARGQERVPFLVMEYLRGESLLALLERERKLSLADAEKILTPLCEAVAEAHEIGVIHRDLKPGNVVLEQLRDGTRIVKVLDFGIAKFVARGDAPAPAPVEPGLPNAMRREIEEVLLSDEGDAVTGPVDGALIDPFDDLLDDNDFLEEVLRARTGATEPPTAVERASARNSNIDGNARDPTTEAGFMIGTIPYMAAEQMTAQKISRRTDVHAVGVLAFELLAGHLPYDGDDEDIIAAKLSDERPSLRENGVDVPPALDELLQRCFAMEPNDRPASVRDIADAVRAAAESARGAPASSDPTMDAVVQLGTLTRTLALARAAAEAWADAAGAQDTYERARDQLLVLDASVRRVRPLVLAIVPPLPKDQRTNALLARDDLEEHSAGVRRALARVPAETSDFSEYLAALWMRLDLAVQELVEALTRLVGGDASSELPAPSLSQLFGEQPSPLTRSPDDIAMRLLARDPLDATDAIDELLEHQVDVVVRALSGDGTPPHVRDRLLLGLWRCADLLLLHEMAPVRRAFRLLPFLARLELPGAQPFSQLAHVMSAPALDRDAAASALAGFSNADDRAAFARCLLVHPVEDVRHAGVDALSLSELWNTIAHGATPPSVLRFVFDRVRTRAPNEYKKIFFFCTKDHLRTLASAAELLDAFALVEMFFAEDCFHEDAVFEPLLDLERALQRRASALSLEQPDAARYAERLAEFTAEGVRESQPLSYMRDVPLAIQRKLAREGYFLNYFVSHANERIARETLPHLFRLEDVTSFLRIPTIHRIVLTELSRKKRFFKKDPAKIALLQNPKLPAVIARMYLPLVPQDQLRLLSTNKHINPDVRRLMLIALHRPDD
jgi:serine/threonine protein kinase